MYIKTEIKKLIGKLFPIDFLEKLTEYSIWRNAKDFDLSKAHLIKMSGNTWQELIEKGREKLWNEAIRYIGDSDIIFMEFGVWQGDSIKFFSKLIQSEKSKLYGFDSFEGLPEQWRGISAGHLSTQGKIQVIDDSRVSFIKGLFLDTLPEFIDIISNESNGKVFLVHLDADLYSSTLFVLYTLAQKIKEFYFIFDEFSGHELRALYNFIQASQAKVEFRFYVMWKGCPMTVFGHIQINA
jgi:hypothetical protein